MESGQQYRFDERPPASNSDLIAVASLGAISGTQAGVRIQPPFPFSNLKPLISGLVSLKPLIKQRIGYFYVLQPFLSELLPGEWMTAEETRSPRQARSFAT